MTKQTKMEDFSNAQKLVRNLVDELLDSGEVNLGLLAYLLVSESVELSFAACDDPNIIFRNVLSAILAKIPHKSDQLNKSSQIIPTICHNLIQWG